MSNTTTSTRTEKDMYYAAMGRLASAAMFEKVRHGDLPGCPPVGYRNARYVHEPPIITDPVLAPLVREAFELAATGRYSLRKLLKAMTAKGLVSRNGKPMGVSAIRNMLGNPFYTGRIRYYGELVPGRHEALVGDNLFVEAREALRRR